VEANQQRGPVSEEQLHELARAGKILPTTVVWREGMANWEPFHPFRLHNQPPHCHPALRRP